MTDEELKAIEARAEAATGFRWMALPQQHRVALWQVSTERLREEPVAVGCFQRDAAFIAAARADVPALVAEVRRLRGLLGEARGYVVVATFDSGPCPTGRDLRDRIDAALGSAPGDGGAK